MEVKNCKKCKRLFNYITGQQICPQCKEELENKFQEVKKYLQDNRGASVSQVSEECDVEESQIRQWIREERLEFSSGIDAGIVCENCGTPISTGRFCDKCKAGMLTDLKSAGKRPEAPVPQQKSNEDHKSRMRFLNSK